MKAQVSSPMPGSHSKPTKRPKMHKIKHNKIKISELKGDVRKLKIKKATIAKGAKRIRAYYDTWEEWVRDPLGYWLFRVDQKKKEIQAGFCKGDNCIRVLINGKDGEEIYNTIVREHLVTSLQHAAYVGYELQKAEFALRFRTRYVQDSKLHDPKQNKRNS